MQKTNLWSDNTAMILYLNQLSNLNEYINISNGNEPSSISWITPKNEVLSPFGKRHDNFIDLIQTDLTRSKSFPNQLVLFAQNGSQNNEIFSMGWAIESTENGLIGTIVYGIDLTHLNERLSAYINQSGITSINLSQSYNDLNVDLYQITSSKSGSRFFQKIDLSKPVSSYEKIYHDSPFRLTIQYNNNLVNKLVFASVLKLVSALAFILLITYLLFLSFRVLKSNILKPVLSDLNASEKKIRRLLHSIKAIEYHDKNIKSQLSERIDNAGILGTLIKEGNENKLDRKLNPNEIHNLLRKLVSELNILNTEEYVQNHIINVNLDRLISLTHDIIYPLGITNDINFQISNNLKKNTFLTCELLLQQIMIALLTRAIENTPREGTVKMEIADVNKNGERKLNIIIKDSGFGIEHDLKRDDLNSEVQNIFTNIIKEINMETIKHNLELLQGTLQIDQVIQQGTQYTLSIKELKLPLEIDEQKDNVYYLK